jgi:hypothetical protein
VFRVEGGQKVRTWGRWLDRHTCVGPLGFTATAQRNVEHGHRQVKQGPGPSVACVLVRAKHRRRGHYGDTKLMVCTRQGKKERGMARNGPTALVRHKCRRTTSRPRECTCTDSTRKNRGLARRWCAQANHRWRSRGDGTTPTTCARQGTSTGGRRAGKCARRGSVLTRLLAKERQGLGSTVACSVCGCRRQTGARRHSSKQRNDTTARQGSARGDDSSGTCKRPARLDGRLSSDGGSVWRHGAGQRATYKQRAHMARSSLGSKAGSTTRSRGFLCSPRAPAGGGEVVTGRGSGADAEQRMQNRARRGSDRGRRTAR